MELLLFIKMALISMNILQKLIGENTAFTSNVYNIYYEFL